MNGTIEASLLARDHRVGADQAFTDNTVMYADSLLPTLRSLALRATEAEGLDLAWVEFKRQGGSWVLRVFIERRDGPVGLADCERVTHRLGLLLDVEDPIESSYTLEVSTPGLDRPLHHEDDYRRFAGHLVRLKLREAVSGRKRFGGRLLGVESGAVLVEDNDGTRHSLPFAAIESGRLEVEFGAPTRDGGRGSGRKGPAKKHRNDA